MRRITVPPPVTKTGPDGKLEDLGKVGRTHLSMIDYLEDVVFSDPNFGVGYESLKIRWSLSDRDWTVGGEVCIEEHEYKALMRAISNPTPNLFNPVVYHLARPFISILAEAKEENL